MSSMSGKNMFECLIIFEIFVSFLVNLSRRLCLVRRPSVRPSVVIVSHFRLLLSNHWTKLSETSQKGRSKRPLPSLCFAGWLTKKKPKMAALTSNFWTIFDFSSETAERNSTKLDSYKVLWFGADQKNKMVALASHWLIYFLFLLWNRYTEFNETWQEARSQFSCLSFLRADRKWRPRPLIGWDIFDVLPCNRLTKFKGTWQEAKSQRPLPCLWFRAIGKTRWPSLPLIDRDILDFPSETAEHNSSKLDRKQDLIVL